MRLNSITFNRVSGEVTFTRGEYVKAWLHGDKYVAGYITGLREHGNVVVVDGLEYERGRIYKTEAPPMPKPRPQAKLSCIVELFNKKHEIEWSDADRVPTTAKEITRL
jgi:hypothetical protein